MNELTPAERVSAGAKFLDERLSGWAKEIDLERLQLDSECGCILGQLYGWFNEASSKLGLRENDTLSRKTADYGFIPYAFFGYEGTLEARNKVKSEYQLLEPLWREEIRVRLAA